MERKLSILKRPSIDITPSGDYCPVINGGTRHSSEDSRRSGTPNDGFSGLQDERPNTNICDYRYDGYTLEITDKVRIVPLFDNRTDNSDIKSAAAVQFNENSNVEPIKTVQTHHCTNCGKNKKSSKRVQFWGYER